MASVELASAYISLVPSAKGISSAIENEMGGPLSAAAVKSGEDTGRSFGASFKKFALIGIAAAGTVGVFAKKTIDAASDMNESVSKTEVVFGDSAAEVEAWGKTSAKAFGLSNQQALEAAGTYGNLFQAFGLGRKEATGMSKSLVETAADLASFNNTSVDDALIALRSGLSGETEPLKRYGVAINDARLKTEAMKLGLIKNTKDALTPAVKAQAAYSLVMHDTSLAQGDFARTSGGLANQQRILEAQTNDLKVAIGEKLLPAKLAVVKFLNEHGIPAFQAFGEKLVDVFNAVKDLANSTIVKWVGDIKSGFADARTAFDEFGKTGDWEAHGTFEVLGVAAAKVTDAIKQSWTDVSTGFNTMNTTGDWDGASTFEKLGIVAARVLTAIQNAWGPAKDAVIGAASDVAGGVLAMGRAFRDGGDDITSSGLAGKLEAVGLKARILFDYLNRNKDTILPIVAGLTAFAGSLLLIQKAQAGIGVIQGLSSALGPLVGLLLGAGPIGLVAAALVAIGVAGFIAYQKLRPFHEFIDRLWQSMQNLWDVITNKVIVAFHALRDAFEVVSSFITDTLIPKVVSIWNTIVETFTPLAKWINENVISTFVAFGEAVGAAVGKIIEAWKILWTFIEPALKLLLSTVTNTFELIVGIFKSFADVALPALAAAWDIIKVPVEIAFGAIKLIVETTLGAIRGIFQVFTGILHGDFSKIWEGFLTLVETPFNAVKGFIGETFNTIWDLIRGFPDRIAGIASGMWNGFKEAFKGMINFIIRGWNSLDFTIGGFELPFPPHTKFPSVTIGLPDIPELKAAGGPVTAGMPFIVGEQGQELFVPRQSGTIIPNGQFGNSGVVVNINTVAGDPQAIWRVLEPVLRNYKVI